MKASEGRAEVFACLARWASVGLLASGVAILQGCGTGGGVERWQMTEARAPQSAPAVPGAAVQPVAVVFYRDPGIAAGVPINVYVNGQYQASLVGNAFTERVLCPGQHSLVVAPDDVRQRYQTRLERRPFDIGNAPMQYFRVFQNATGRIDMAPVAADAALTAVPSLRARQSHTISRVTRTGCPAA